MAEIEIQTLKVLHLEDDSEDAELVKSILREAGITCNIKVAKSRGEFETAIREEKYDLILSDYSLPSFSGNEALQMAREVIPATPFVFVSGTLGEDAAIQALLDGATDYVLKTKMSRLVPAVKRAIREADARAKLKLAEKLREMALEDLRSSEARFRGVLESAPDAAIIVDSRGRITFANAQTERIFGFSPEDLIGRSLEILVPDNYREMHRRHILEYRNAPHARAMSAGIELHGKRRDGTVFPADIMLSPIRMDHDTSVLAMIRDITVAKESERVLRESEELFRSIYEASPVGIINVDREGRIIKSNLAATRLLGYSAAELQRMRFNDFTPDDDTQLGVKMLGSLLDGEEEVVDFEGKYIRKTGELIRVRLTVSAVRNDEKSVRYAVAIMEDITERWKAETSLRRSEERYRSLVDNARDAIYTLSANATILSLNPAFESLTGWRREDWLGRSFTDLVHPSDKERARDSFGKTLSGEFSDVIQYNILKKSGDYAVAEFSVTSFILENGSVGVLGIARDVTSQIAMEEQLRQSQKMESIGTLAGGIAHDFNNILGIIIGYSSLVLRSAKGNKALIRNIKSIESAAQRGVGLVRQLLMFARKQERVLQTLDVNNLVADVYKMISETFPKVISIKFVRSTEPVIVRGDQTEIHQAVLNLCVNARDAMMDSPGMKLSGGSLVISTSIARGQDVREGHSDAASEAYVSISVSDTGAGMDDATKERIFEPFFTTKEKGKGTGLGLSTVYGIIRAYDGFVDVSSSVGEGTTFTLLLPLLEPPEPKPDEHEDQTAASLGGTESVLVVEDEAGLRELLLEVLRSRGYRVLSAEDGQRALALFLDHGDIDLVLSDIGLPKVGGLDLFQAIRKLKPEVKVILVSGYVNEADRERIMKVGVSSFVQKPYRPLDVLKKIREALDAP